MRTVSAFRGEFGNLVSRHAPYVNALAGPKEVEIERGMEALYPGAKVRIVEGVPDDDRRGTRGLPPKGAPMKYFRPVPRVWRGLPRHDIVICPRKRRYGAAKNWPCWPALAEGLATVGMRVFAAGNREASDTTVQCKAAWEFERTLDASIEAMLSAKLVVATDAGLAHLAVASGVPLLLVTHRGLTAPGPQVDASGRVMQPEYGPVEMSRYTVANHLGIRIETIDGWEHPEPVIQRALELVK